MAVLGTYIRFSMQSANTVIEYSYHPSRSDLWNTLDAWEREEKARQMFAWKEPKKCIPVSTVHILMKYQNRFTGCKFPIGGPKK